MRFNVVALYYLLALHASPLLPGLLRDRGIRRGLLEQLVPLLQVPLRHRALRLVLRPVVDDLHGDDAPRVQRGRPDCDEEGGCDHQALGYHLGAEPVLVV